MASDVGVGPALEGGRKIPSGTSHGQLQTMIERHGAQASHELVELRVLLAIAMEEAQGSPEHPRRRARCRDEFREPALLGCLTGQLSK